MATVAGVTPEALAAAGREDAGRVMREQQERRDGDEMLARVRAMDTDQTRELLATIALQLGVNLTESEQDGGDRRYGT